MAIGIMKSCPEVDQVISISRLRVRRGIASQILFDVDLDLLILDARTAPLADDVEQTPLGPHDLKEL